MHHTSKSIPEHRWKSSKHNCGDKKRRSGSEPNNTKQLLAARRSFRSQRSFGDSRLEADLWLTSVFQAGKFVVQLRWSKVQNSDPTGMAMVCKPSSFCCDSCNLDRNWSKQELKGHHFGSFWESQIQTRKTRRNQWKPGVSIRPEWHLISIVATQTMRAPGHRRCKKESCTQRS